MDDKSKNIEDIITKIKGCLALANDGADSDESDTAMLLAQKMMMKYNLSINDIDYDNKPIRKNVMEGDGTEYTKLQWWMKSLALIIADNFRCYTFTRSFNKRTKITFLGLEQDIAVCKAIYEFALIKIKFHSDNYIKKRGIGGNRGTTIAVKNDYIAGYLQGLKAKFKEQVETEGLALILLKDALVVREYEGYTMGSGSRIKRKTSGDSDAMQKGYSDGKKFSH
jgi:hypothetical protein